MISNFRSALRATFTGWRKRRAARDKHAIARLGDERIERINKFFNDRIEAQRRREEDAQPPLHPLTHQRRPVNPARYPGAVSLDDAARRVIEDEDDAVLAVVGDENTGPLPRHLARSGWSR